ncbi:hypothetical protein B0I18_10513 [Taibaiella chishuiensis]|uniref:Uncharacterized protein n=2 Tax=Taibaiella chishuiensis TaxID=1434707 RepID=A0A2P8D2I2_9BACT|nr:hypothetical protein B0I18_10513 [Taibaiella chishuiensis]
MIAMNAYLIEKLSGLYCITHRLNANVFINDEGFITVASCCDEFHETLYHAQEAFRSQYQAAQQSGNPDDLA